MNTPCVKPPRKCKRYQNLVQLFRSRGPLNFLPILELGAALSLFSRVLELLPPKLTQQMLSSEKLSDFLPAGGLDKRTQD